MSQLDSRTAHNGQQAIAPILGRGGRVVLKPPERGDDRRRSVQRDPRHRRRVLTLRLRPGTASRVRNRAYGIVESLDQQTLGLGPTIVPAGKRSAQEHAAETTAETDEQGDDRRERIHRSRA